MTQVPPGGAQAVPQIFTEVCPRDGGPDRQKHVGSPVDMLADTVARMQLDLTFGSQQKRISAMRTEC